MDSVHCAVASFLVVLAIVRADIRDSCSNTNRCYPNYGTQCIAGTCSCDGGYSAYTKRPGWCIRDRRSGSATHGIQCDSMICADTLICNTLRGGAPQCACPDTIPTWNPTTHKCVPGTRPNPCIPTVNACTDSSTIQRPTTPTTTRRPRPTTATTTGPLGSTIAPSGPNDDGKGQLGKTCDPEAEPNECDLDVGQNLECDKQTKQCECPDNTEYSPSAMACKLKAGEDCYIKDEQGRDLPEHDLCLSHYCGTTEQQVLDMKCTCPDDNGSKTIWLHDYGCVTDYYDKSCTVETDCFNSSIQVNSAQLFCKDGHCACKNGSTYSQAECLNATKLYNDKCDREDTCVTAGGTSLTCKDIGTPGNPNMVCQCLPRLEPRAETSDRYIPLTWNSDTKICDLSPLDSRCARGSQCKSRNCQNGKCAERAKKAGAGIPVIGSPYKWLVLIGQIIFILKNN